MKLFEMIETVDTLVPNTIPTDRKIIWINQIQRQLFRDYPLPESVQVFVVKMGQQLYVLPDDCPEDRITTLVIDNRSYEFADHTLTSDVTPDRFYNVVSGTLMIYPNPTAETSGMLYYNARPAELTSDMMDQEPTFPKDFHEILVFGCASRVAKSHESTMGQAAIFDGDYRMLAEKADLVLRKHKQKKAVSVRAWQ